MPTSFSSSSQHNIPLRLLTSLLTTMWKTKRVFFVLFISVSCILSAFYILSRTESTPFHHHHHHHPHLHSGRDLNLPPAGDEAGQGLLQPLALHANNGSNDPKVDPGGKSGPKPLLRILVLTYKRDKSLKRCLDSLNEAEYDDLPVELDIHVDRGKDDKVHNQTLHAASSFIFKHGPVRVLVRPRHGGVVGQWLASWRVPRDNASEIAVVVEDDITLSPFFARWLRRVHDKYDNYPNIGGYSLQAESTTHAVGPDAKLQGPAGQSVFAYPVLGSWGFSPHTGRWREFLRWYHQASQDPKFVPVVPGLKPSVWYQAFVKSGRTETMWTMWHIYYTTQHKQYTVYPHLPEDQGLSFNWKEPGEHYSKAVMGKGLRARLLRTWREEDVRLPEKLVIIDAKGKVTGQKLSPLGLE